MILRYYGHSLFTLAFENGFTLLTDPYGDFYDYPKRTLKADIVTVSHYHHDHDALGMVEGKPQVFDKLGVYSPIADIILTGVASKHDAKDGAQRGDNLIFIIEAEDMKIVHMGDIGHMLTDRQRQYIGTPDVLLTPVGGLYTTDAKAAYDNVKLLRPRVVIPMHYRTRFSAEMPITTEKPFLELMHANPEPMPLLRLTKGDISERPPVILMDIITKTAS